jgi:hypothetical protein
MSREFHDNSFACAAYSQRANDIAAIVALFGHLNRHARESCKFAFVAEKAGIGS